MSGLGNMAFFSFAQKTLATVTEKFPRDKAKALGCYESALQVESGHLATFPAAITAHCPLPTAHCPLPTDH